MYLERLQLWNFRCYENLDVGFDSKFNVVSGLNGQGKTALLEAIYLLATMKSFRSAKNSELIRWNEEGSLIRGVTTLGPIQTDLALKIHSKSKAATANGKTCRFLSEYVGKLAAVTFSPADLEILRGGPELRRTWLDRVSTVFHLKHADTVSRYGKVLAQRNRILRDFASGKARLPADMSVWDEQLCYLGAEVIHSRINTVDKLGALVSQHYGRISGGSETVRFTYQSDSFEGVETRQETLHSVDSISQILKEKQEQMLPKECIIGVTLVGPHRDDLDVALNDRSLKSFGSQGEVRSTALAMRLSEVQVYKDLLKTDPVLLVDDFSSELDQNRRDYLLQYLEESASQIFISTTENLALGNRITVSQGRVQTHGQ